MHTSKKILLIVKTTTKNILIPNKSAIYLFNFLSKLENLDGGNDKFNPSLVSTPVYTTIPTMYSVFLNMEPLTKLKKYQFSLLTSGNQVFKNYKFSSSSYT
jgi:hypothetical protein